MRRATHGPQAWATYQRLVRAGFPHVSIPRPSRERAATNAALLAAGVQYDIGAEHSWFPLALMDDFAVVAAVHVVIRETTTRARREYYCDAGTSNVVGPSRARERFMLRAYERNARRRWCGVPWTPARWARVEGALLLSAMSG